MPTPSDTGRMARLAQGLLAKTLSNEIEWVTLADEPTAFRAELPSGIVRIVSVDRDGAPPYGLATYARTGGDPLDFISTLQPSIAADPVTRLYQTVSRRLAGADAVLDALINDVTGASSTPSDDDVPF